MVKTVASALRLFAAEREPAEALVEARDLPARIDEALVAAGPCRMRRRIDVERHRVALFAPGGTRLEQRAVGHLHLDQMIVGVRVFQIGRAHAELQSLMRISYAVFCLKKKKKK